VAGGQGITGSRCVHSVGSSGVPAGNAKEVVVWPERLVAVAVLSSVGEAPRSCAADPRPWSCRQLLEAVWCANKSPSVAVTAEPDRDLGAEVVRWWNRALASAA
jgi:hypothetical protein